MRRASNGGSPPGLVSLEPGPRLLDGLRIDRTLAPAPGFRGGPTEGRRRLRRFVAERLAGYADARNHPEHDGTSELSPYLHFGHLGPREVALAIRDSGAPLSDRQAFLEQLIVRRELGVNFVRFNDRYDQLAGCEPWALETLRRHHRDRRPHLYSARQLEQADTHDELWNAAQRQMVTTGWMHGYVRMYWAKKILEWTRSPEEAFAVAIELNDRYEIDGRDPNGYAGIAWAIGGKHDRAWGPERPVFGTIRYMSFGSTSRKFDSRRYIERWMAPAAARHGPDPDSCPRNPIPSDTGRAEGVPAPARPTSCARAAVYTPRQQGEPQCAVWPAADS